VPEGVILMKSGETEKELKAHLPAGRLAVRSSGFSEDSQSASFAGLYETVLGVQGLAETTAAVQRCFASFSNQRSETYRATRGNGPSGGTVIVQRLIDAEAAGVAFTIDPEETEMTSLRSVARSTTARLRSFIQVLEKKFAGNGSRRFFKIDNSTA